MNKLDDSQYQEVYRYAHKMLHRGDSFAAIRQYLHHKEASEEQYNTIMDLLAEEHKLLEELKAPLERKLQKRKLINQSVLQLVIGIAITIVAWFFNAKSLAVNTFFTVPLIAFFVGGFLCLLGTAKLITIFFFRKD